MSVQAEVTRALAANDDFRDISSDDPDAARRTSGRCRGTLEDERPAFVVQDGIYLSARWPGDVHTAPLPITSPLLHAHPGLAAA